MTSAELDAILGRLGLCGCAYDSSLWLVRELLEIAEARLWEDEDHDELCELRLRAALPEPHSGAFVLGALGVNDLIAHEDGELWDFWLTEHGGEVLGGMRQREADAQDADATEEKARMN